MGLPLYPLSWLYLSGGDGVTVGLKGDQAVFPDPPQILLRHQIGCSGSGVKVARSASARTAMTWPWLRWT